MKKKRKLYSLILVLCLLAAGIVWYLAAPWEFPYPVPAMEAVLRMQLVETAEGWLGIQEEDGSHQQILDIYNAQDPLPVGYAVQPEDSWCAAFVSAAALRCGFTQGLPTECSCQRQIGLFQERNRWEENDWYLPVPGDIIYYDWDQTRPGECTGWSDHVGIVVGVKWPFVKVIEGNRDDKVCYRTILLGDIHIRGYGVPDYSLILRKNTP